jgi:hypothetical protein
MDRFYARFFVRLFDSCFFAKAVSGIIAAVAISDVATAAIANIGKVFLLAILQLICCIYLSELGK